MNIENGKNQDSDNIFIERVVSFYTDYQKSLADSCAEEAKEEERS